MTNLRIIPSPIPPEIIATLKAGEEVLVSGIIYTARDAAHRRFAELIRKGEPLPIDLRGQTIYYAGPSPTPPGEIIGSIGPTTSSRMDAFTPTLLEYGVVALIGKGNRSNDVCTAIAHFKSVYFAALGGAAAILAKSVIACEIVCWDELGTEAVRRLTVVNMPVITAIDSYGTNLYTDGPRQYALPHRSFSP